MDVLSCVYVNVYGCVCESVAQPVYTHNVVSVWLIRSDRRTYTSAPSNVPEENAIQFI